MDNPDTENQDRYTSHMTNYNIHIMVGKASQVALAAKNPLANARDVRDAGSISGLGRSPGGAHGNPLQDSCLENPTDRGAWGAIVHRFARAGLKHAYIMVGKYYI